MRALFILAIAAALAAGCEKQQQPAPPPPPPAGGTARPAELVVDVVLSSVSAFDGLRAFVSAVEPSMAGYDDASLLREIAVEAGLTSIDGLDPGAPIHVLVLEHDADHGGIALLAKVRDAAKLQAGKGSATVEARGGWAVVGPTPLVRAVAPYALGMLASEPPPAQLTAIVYPPRLLADHAGAFARFRAQMLAAPGMSGDGGTFMTSYLDGLSSIAHEADEVRVTLDANAAEARLDLAFVPHPRSRFAAFVAQQRPDDFRLLDALPPSAAQLVFGGRLRWGPYRTGAIEMMAQLYRTPAGEIGSQMVRLMNATSGTIAVAGRFDRGGMTMTQVAGLDDPAAAKAALDRILARFANGVARQVGPTAVTYRAITPPLEHDHVPLLRFETTYDTSQAPAATRAMIARMSPGMVQHTAFATFDHEMVFAMAGDAAGEVARAIDVERGNAAGLTLPPASAALVDAARARKDSAILLVDVGSLRSSFGHGSGTPAQFSMTLGTAGGELHLGFTLPVASIQALRHH